MDKNRPIGVFDSGAGGLTVLKELKRLMPDESFIFFGDIKNSPYGDKSPDQIFAFAKNNIEFLISKGVKAIVVACNTASSYNIKELRREYKLPIVTVLESGANYVNDTHDNILLTATKATIESGYYKKLIETINPKATVYTEVCADIVPHIEDRDLKDDKQIQDIVDGHINKYLDKEVDLLILGCTHFPIWRKYFEKSIGKEEIVFDPATKVSLDMLSYLKIEGMETDSYTSFDKFYVSANKECFFENAKSIIPDIKIEQIELV